MKIGYARVSTKDQELKNQRARLEAARCELFFEEKISGAAQRRCPRGHQARSLGTAHFRTSTHRRNSEKNLQLQFFNEILANTTTPAGKMIMIVFGGIAEFERSPILTRTQGGREAALARGVAFGRASKLRADQKDVIRDLVKSGQSIAAVARTFNVHPATIYRCLEEKQAL